MANHILPQSAVCDRCRVRKVKCDRDIPCGNCVDGNIECLRTTSAARNTSRHQRAAKTLQSYERIQHHSLEDHNASPLPARSDDSSQPSATQTCHSVKQDFSFTTQVPANRLAVIDSAMTFANGLSQTIGNDNVAVWRGAYVVDVLAGINTPPIELLYWMLCDINANDTRLHARDYFKHVSAKSLEAMGLALINRTADPESLLLYSICVGVATFKFINLVLSEGNLGAFEGSMRACNATYLSSVKLAMTRMSLTSAPSLLFLQSLLCSAFVAQDAGNATQCWAFVSAACKTCADLNIRPHVITCGADTHLDEEKYHCYIWCHILDKNYSMMLGKRRCILEHEELDSVFASRLSASLSPVTSLYLQFVPIQAIFVSELQREEMSNDGMLQSRAEDVITDLLGRMMHLDKGITEVRNTSNACNDWLTSSELTIIEFSYHTLRTSIICQTSLPRMSLKEDLGQSARMTMTAFRNIQEAAMKLTDVKGQASYTYWTLLSHRLIPYLILFCDLIASFDERDLPTVCYVIKQIEALAILSSSNPQLRSLLNSFVDLCRRLAPHVKERGLEEMEADECVLELYRDASRAQPQGQSTSELPGLCNEADVFSIPQISSPVHPSWGTSEMQLMLGWSDTDMWYVGTH